MMERKTLSGAALKYIAFATMFIDHVGAGFVARMGLPENLQFIYIAMRFIGRIAFPIFIFLLVEGYTKTKSKVRYGARLLVFALISEIPFDLLFMLNDVQLASGQFIEFYGQNVLFTLLLGIIAMAAMDYVDKMTEGLSDRPSFLLVRGGINIFIVAVFYAIGEYVLRCDYGGWGVVAIAVMYYLRENRYLGVFIMCVTLFLPTRNIGEIPCLFSLLALVAYNGERGKQNKWVGYLFYPVHLLLIFAAAFFMGYIMI
ncbi:MAG: conjugal transfer protein TraX [Lachnospiraceae bacterium]|nr:conjugal transfer protein TraX [Lachnospiraceae bacterium]